MSEQCVYAEEYDEQTTLNRVSVREWGQTRRLHCVGALLVRQKRILLGKRTAACDLSPSVWDLPGGHVERQETREQTLERELNEEIGVVPTAWRRLKTLYVPDMGDDEYEVQIYLVAAWRGTPHNRAPAEHDDLRWFTIEEASCLPLAHPDYPTLFRQAVRAKFTVTFYSGYTVSSAQRIGSAR
jgi:8-oxo-dGTP diphosphatase